MLHADDVRKDEDRLRTPAGVALVLEDAGTEEEAIAAAARRDRDRGTPEAEIRARFGQPIADIVVACTEPRIDRNASTWRERKTRYIKHLEVGVGVGAR